MLTDEQMAAALIATKAAPAGLAAVRNAAGEAWAYNRLTPYPLYHFRNWMTEDRGPLPRCLPLAQGIVRRGARWLFGRPLELQCAGNDAWQKWVQKAWDDNAMPARLVPLAVRGALEGGIALKFDIDTARDVPLAIQSLSLVDQVRFFYSPHDRRKLLMARVQYPYFDAPTGRTLWYREEWTEAEEVHYVPLVVPGDLSRFNPDTAETWEIDSREANPMGVIPVCHVKNLETDDCWGAPDLADLYRVIDGINLTYHLMNRSNQFDAETNPIFIDADLDEQDIDRPHQPGQPIDLHTEEGATSQAKVMFPGGGNALRPAMMEYAKDLRNQVLTAAGSVEVDIKDVSHMGNLTRAVLTQTYLPQIETADEKRKSWGGGIKEFFALVAKALDNLGGEKQGIALANPDSYTLSLRWPQYFDMSEDEKAVVVGRMQEAQAARLITADRAVGLFAQAEGIEDVDALKEELKAEPLPSLTETDTAADTTADDAAKNVVAMRRVGGPSAE